GASVKCLEVYGTPSLYGAGQQRLRRTTAEEQGGLTVLILTRSPGETIRIGDDITVTVLQVTGMQVKIGVSADKAVSIHREEIYRRIQANRTPAKAGGSND